MRMSYEKHSKVSKLIREVDPQCDLILLRDDEISLCDPECICLPYLLVDTDTTHDKLYVGGMWGKDDTFSFLTNAGITPANASKIASIIREYC